MDWFETQQKSPNSQSCWSIESKGRSNNSRPIMFTHRIVKLEYYLENPHKEYDPLVSSLRSHEVKKVPILRIFGATPEGTG